MRKLFFYFGLICSFSCVSAQGDDDRLLELQTRLAGYSESVDGLADSANLSIANASLKELFRALAESHNLNINMRRVPEVLVYNNFNNVRVSDLLAFLCFEYHLDIQLMRNILMISRFQSIPEMDFDYQYETDRISFGFEKDTLRTVVAQLTSRTPYNVIVSPNIRNTPISVHISELRFDMALEQLAIANNLELKKTSDSVFLLEYIPPPVVENQIKTGGRSSLSRRGSRSSSNAKYSIRSLPDKKLLTVNATEVKAFDLISQIGEELGIGYAFINEPDGSLDCFLTDVTFDDFLDVALSTSKEKMSFTIKDNVFLIGNESNTSISESSVYRFRNRSVETVTESIPEHMLEQIEVDEFLDLNALILTGSQSNTKKLISFLEQIDQPVPNIMIEVMVIEVSKGFATATGISAGLADSSVQTSGTMFPNVDMTLSSSSVNDVLSKISNMGLINLGRVTPTFYATIQALENNNLINLRSTPKLSALNGNEASLKIGQSEYYLIETQSVSSGINPIITTTPQYEKVEANLEIKIKPFVSFNEYVTLTIESEFSDFIDPTSQGAPPGNATRQFISKIRIKNEEMIVLGGLEEATQQESGKGTPGLSRIPILKWLFSSRSKIENEKKLLIFIKPTIVY